MKLSNQQKLRAARSGDANMAMCLREEAFSIFSQPQESIEALSACTAAVDKIQLGDYQKAYIEHASTADCRRFLTADWSSGRTKGRDIGGALFQLAAQWKPKGYRQVATPRFPTVERLAELLCTLNKSLSPEMSTRVACLIVRANDSGLFKQGWDWVRIALADNCDREFAEVIAGAYEKSNCARREHMSLCKSRTEQTREHIKLCAEW